MLKYSAKDLLHMPQKDRPFQVNMVKQQQIKTEATQYTRMSDIDGTEALYISESTGYYVVDARESVIFYSDLETIKDK